MNPEDITPEILARTYRDAAAVLEAGELHDLTCCGHPLTPLGQCRFRPGHPTPANPAILSYPNHYDSQGRFLL